MELSGGRIEVRMERLFLKLGDDIGRPRPGGTFIPMSLSRQEVADMIGTTIETSIRILSKWGKQQIVIAEKDGFVIADREAAPPTDRRWTAQGRLTTGWSGTLLGCGLRGRRVTSAARSERNV